MEIKVIGMGCDKCDALYANTLAALEKAGITARVEKVEDVVNIGDMVWVKVTDIDEKGRVNLSLRDAQREIAAMEARDAKKHQN